MNKAQAYFDSGYPEVTSSVHAQRRPVAPPRRKVPWAVENLPVPASTRTTAMRAGVLQPGAIALEAALTAARPADPRLPAGAV